MKEGNQNTQWVLGFDGDCSTSTYLAEKLISLSDGRLTGQSLRTCNMRRWRIQALGEEAPWAPTLFSIDGRSVRAWTGAALVLKLGQLLGPRKMWKAVGLVGELVDRPVEPESPGRRLVIQKGIAGATAAIAIMAGGVGPAWLVASAQVEGEAKIKTRWDFADLHGGKYKDLKRQAGKDRDFGIISEYFADQRDWRVHRRDGTRISKNGNRVRDGFIETYKNPGEDEWAHVVYGKEEGGGKEWAYGYLWRNGRFTDRFYVKNGNLKRDNGGRVEGAEAEAQPEGDTLLCGTIAYAPCGLATGLSAVACAATVFTTCGLAAAFAGVCFSLSGTVYNTCKDNA